MARIMEQFHVRHMTSIVEHQLIRTCMPIMAPRRTVGSLAAAERFETYDLRQFLRLSQNITEAGATSNEWFPGEFLNPTKRDIDLPKDVYSLLIEYYAAAYESCKFCAVTERLAGRTIVDNVTTKHGRMRIGAEIFGSIMSSRHRASAFILARFAGGRGGEVDTYAGQVQYYIKHTQKVGDTATLHYLAYVRWYRPAPTASRRFHYALGGVDCGIELWLDEFYENSRDSIIPVHQIAGRFVPFEVTMGRTKHSKYLAVIPLNRRFHI